MSLFDSIQETVFNIVNTTFGNSASWTPSSGIPAFTALVLFKDATETAKILDQPYSPKNCMIEYKKGDFNGLYQAAAVGSEETININLIDYAVLKVTSKWDGKTMIAELQQL